MAAAAAATRATKETERFNTMMKTWISQFAHLLQSTDVKDHIEGLIIEPFMNYILGRTFPYMILAFCLFGAIFLFVILTFVLLLMRQGPPSTCSACRIAAAAAAGMGVSI